MFQWQGGCGRYIREGSVAVAKAFKLGEDNTEMDANARLIAAAPDLLEALQNLLECHPSPGEPGSPMFNARAAIIKATSDPKDKT